MAKFVSRLNIAVSQAHGLSASWQIILFKNVFFGKAEGKGYHHFYFQIIEEELNARIDDFSHDVIISPYGAYPKYAEAEQCEDSQSFILHQIRK